MYFLFLLSPLLFWKFVKSRVIFLLFSFLSNQKVKCNADQEPCFGEVIRKQVYAPRCDEVVLPRQPLPTKDDSQNPRHGIQNDHGDNQYLNPDRFHLFFNPTSVLRIGEPASRILRHLAGRFPVVLFLLDSFRKDNLCTTFWTDILPLCFCSFT